jgi:peptidyl-prolyl cis-trans isomerase A (cyclophilin A)
LAHVDGNLIFWHIFAGSLLNGDFSAGCSFAAAPADAATTQRKTEQSMNPAQMNETAPERFQVKFDTTKGEFTVDVTRAWSPNGADRFYNLVKNGLYNNCRFFRVVENFIVQFGINGDPGISKIWRSANIPDDSSSQSNTRGSITFATAGKNTRTTQLFINFGNNSFLDSQGFTPFGKVTQGMDIVDAIENKYGEQPNQGLIQSQGNAYLEKSFPDLDFIKSATITGLDAAS